MLRHPGRRAGFTLLEMVLAATILAMFVLPLLEIIAAARSRVYKYTQDRIIRDLAQKKLFDRMYFIEKADEGTFELDGHPDWRWQMPGAEVVSQGDQLLLQYSIRVILPGADAGADSSDTRSSFEMSAWTFPSSQWYDEQELLGNDPTTGLPMDGSGGMGGGALPLGR